MPTLDPQHLRTALRALNLTPTMVVRMLPFSQGYNLMNFVADRDKLDVDTLSALAHQFPNLNVRYVLTGQGSPILS